MRRAQELVKHWMDVNIAGWKTFGAQEYEEAKKAAEEEVNPRIGEFDLNGDGKFDLYEYMAINPAKGEL